MKQKLGVFTLTLASSFLIMAWVGSSYSKYVSPITPGFWGPSHPEYITGFILAFLFSGSVLPWVLLKDDKFKRLLKYTVPFLIIMLLLQAIEESIIGLGLVLIGWLLGWGILKVKQSLQKNKTPIV